MSFLAAIGRALPEARRYRPVRPAARRTALILPYGCVEGMAPGDSIWERLTAPVRGCTDIYGLMLPWGIVPEPVFKKHASFMAYDLDIPDRQSARDASDRIRAWMETKGRTYHAIAFVVYGPLIDVWSQGVGGSLAAEAVSLVKVPQRMDGLLQASVSRKICSIIVPDKGRS